MRQVTITGRLGSDPKIEQTKNGSKYITFRFASQEYGESEPLWMTVRSFNDSHINRFGKYLKKGSSIIVSGDYSDKLFQGKDGYIIIRDVIASSMYFNSTGEKRETTNAGETTQHPQQATVQTTGGNNLPDLANEFGYNNSQNTFAPQQQAQYSDSDLPF